MVEQQIRFEDGAAYERMMGKWSQLAGNVFVEWLAPSAGLRWIDVGCGNGAFTNMIVEQCAPAKVNGIDPSEGQLAFARTRPSERAVEFGHGDAMALPFPDKTFDVATMALVIFFSGTGQGQSGMRCVRSAFFPGSHQAPARLGWRRCGSCGRWLVSMRSRRKK